MFSPRPTACSQMLDGESPLHATAADRNEDEGFDVSPEEENALLAAIAQADRGEVVSWEQLRERLCRFG